MTSPNIEPQLPEFKQWVIEQVYPYRWHIIIVCVAIALGLLSSLFLGKGNVVEVGAEKVIEAETGVKIDL